MTKWCSVRFSKPGCGANRKYRMVGLRINSLNLPYCSYTCPFHSLRSRISSPTRRSVTSSLPCCHCLTSSDSVRLAHTLAAAALYRNPTRVLCHVVTLLFHGSINGPQAGEIRISFTVRQLAGESLAGVKVPEPQPQECQPAYLYGNGTSVPSWTNDYRL
jgi:hypothetical protein